MVCNSPKRIARLGGLAAAALAEPAAGLAGSPL